ncbi:GMC family oxidoreductase [Methylobacterium platani]|uniref:Sorbosone dehydrogenase n=2 Tax=Methylobacterium platani TaxID=427683 RepID=A0A179RZM0_9HYPH|nr:GMC family oxidoreductase N-terminal domain-containing protein [Methylobacterium platani]KMO19903.1 sorbosone dehydrogenase [Methylobacterium platani JCM 14648]OAS18085.1 sorbosone dehydrogenase [Methylobacterium platani]
MTRILILGGGSAGCVLAARLSEEPSFRVTLVEAGDDLTAAAMPPEIRSRYPGRAYLDPRNIWPALTARMGAPAGNRPEAPAPRAYEQARRLGGGSAINAMMANRGAPGDYDAWGALGAEGWSWEACLPYFRKLESDRDHDGPLHGRDGPLPIRRAAPDRLSPFVAATMRALVAQGYPAGADQNGPWRDGVYAGTTAISDEGERVPVSVAYLTPAVRARANLVVRTGLLAERVLFEGRRAVGAAVAPLAGGPSETIPADRVVVAAGAIHSPALLMRSGVGPGAALGRHGVPVIADRPGVGRNLMEHPSIAVSAYLTRAGRVRDRGEHHEQAILRYSSGLPGTPPGDMHGAILSRTGWHSVGERIGGIFFWVNTSYSRGEVVLASPDPRSEPQVDFRMLSDPRDHARLMDAVRRGARALRDPALAAVRGPVFPASYSPRVARAAAPKPWPAAQRGILSGLLDLAGPARAALIHGLVTQGVTLDRLLADERALAAFVSAEVGGTWHPSGTCRMGAADDPMSVCDGLARVRGVEALSVCDASLMPTIPRANTNIPTVMMAERVADLIRRDGAASYG